MSQQFAKGTDSSEPASAPRCIRHALLHTEHGIQRPDPYHWLRHSENPAVLSHLKAENTYTESVLAPVRQLRDDLYRELLGRIKEADTSAPWTDGPWEYRTRTVKGLDYPIHERRPHPATPDSTWLPYFDENKEADGKDYFDLGQLDVSPDGHLMAYAVDTAGDERYQLRFRDLRTGSDLPDTIAPVTADGEWAADSQHYFYVVEDDTRRPWRILRHQLGTDPAKDSDCLRETDPAFYLGLDLSQDRRFLFALSESKETTATWFLPADQPEASFSQLLPRHSGIRTYPDHHRGTWLLRTNFKATDFQLLALPLGSSSYDKAAPIRPAEQGNHLEDFLPMAEFLVLFERQDGADRIRVQPWDDPEAAWAVPAPDEVFARDSYANAEYDSPYLNYTYSSPIRPETVFRLDLRDGSQTVLKERAIPSGHDPARYTVSRQWTTAPDGTRVPLTVFHQRDLPLDGQRPAWLYGYGAYGATIEPGFRSSWLSFLERGFVLAIAHVRGGGFLGESWYQEGKLEHKSNSFTDFLAAADHLVSAGYTSPQHLAIEGGSAGGLLIGAVLNLRPKGFAAAVAEVPFVDVLTTMLDPSLPLTTFEYEEWGDPRQRTAFETIHSYSPYDNVHPAHYPAVLVTAGLHDSRVPYWEAAKWAARLRDNQLADRPVLLQINLDSGHAGPSGRYAYLREIALQQAFILHALQQPPSSPQ